MKSIIAAAAMVLAAGLAQAGGLDGYHLKSGEFVEQYQSCIDGCLDTVAEGTFSRLSQKASKRDLFIGAFLETYQCYWASCTFPQLDRLMLTFDKALIPVNGMTEQVFPARLLAHSKQADMICRMNDLREKVDGVDGRYVSCFFADGQRVIGVNLTFAKNRN